EFLVVQMATTADDGAAGAGEGERGKSGTVLGAYTSVERVREVPGTGAGTGAGTGDGGDVAAIEWVMGTVSDARGVLPAWMQKMAVPGQVAKDVDMFLSWIANERTKDKKDQAEGDGGREDNAA